MISVPVLDLTPKGTYRLHCRMFSFFIIYIYTRCESFNSRMRTYNIYGNKAALSRDIAMSFAVAEHLKYMASGGLIMDANG